MLFSSISFLYYFLPCVLMIYHIVPEKFKNGALLLASLVFYGWGEPKYLFLMLAMILIHYISGLVIDRQDNCVKRKAVFTVTMIISVGTLSFFKFSNVAWPIGISFYTFQLISYLADVYRGTVGVQKNIIHLGAYVTMFPQLIAGPIVRYTDIERQLRERSLQWSMVLEGSQRFLIGLGKKILISNALGELCAIFRESDEKSVVFFWVYALSYTLQIYFDFSGYSDMAIGLGKMFGFDFLENFRYPYISKSITEFWRRWHMSLGSWFRDYVYIPLGGNRVSKGRWYLNIFIVWCLTGLWHGGSLQFVVWGLLFAVLLVFEKQWFLKKLEKGRIWNRFYVLLVVIFSFVIFGATDMKEAWEYIKGMLGFGKIPFLSSECIYYMKSYGVLIVAAMIGSTPVIKGVFRKLEEHATGKKLVQIFRSWVLLLLLAVCTAYLVDSSFNPFLYFRF